MKPFPQDVWSYEKDVLHASDSSIQKLFIDFKPWIIIVIIVVVVVVIIIIIKTSFMKIKSSEIKCSIEFDCISFSWFANFDLV